MTKDGDPRPDTGGDTGDDAERGADGRDDDGRLEELFEDAIEVQLEAGHDETVEKAKRNVFVRIGIVVGGSVVLVLGLLMLVLPGPGLLMIVLGLGLLASEIPFAARLLERARARLPQDESGKVSPWVIVISVFLLILSITASLWFTFGRN